MRHVLKLKEDSTFSIIDDTGTINDSCVLIDELHKSFNVVHQMHFEIKTGLYRPVPNAKCIYNKETELVEFEYNDDNVRGSKIEELNHQIQNPRIVSNALGSEYQYSLSDLQNISNLTGIHIKCINVETNETEYKSHNKTQITKLLSNANGYQKKLNAVYKRKIKELIKLTGIELMNYDCTLKI